MFTLETTLTSSGNNLVCRKDAYRIYSDVSFQFLTDNISHTLYIPIECPWDELVMVLTPHWAELVVKASVLGNPSISFD